MSSFKIEDREIGDNCSPLVIAEIGINHEGSFPKAVRMVNDAYDAGCECVKFQCHVIEDEMANIAKKIIPGHTTESIWEIMQRCALTEEQEREIQKLVRSKGMIYLSTPFSRAAAIRLESMDVPAYKIGSGECNNYPLLKHVAQYGKPIILSTGMNDIPSISKSVDILREADVPFALTHCTSLYPTPYHQVRLGAIPELKQHFPDAIVGLSDHTVDSFSCLASIPLGARILERHFTSDKQWPGPDINISMDPEDLSQLIKGASAIFQMLGGNKEILPDEQPTIDFAYSCVVAIAKINKGEPLTTDNIWVKRPGTGEIKAKDFETLLGRKAATEIEPDSQINWDDITS